MILVQTKKLRDELFALFLDSLHILHWNVYPDHGILLFWPKERHLMWLYFSTLSHAFYQLFPCDDFYPSVASSYPHVLVLVHHYFCYVAAVLYAESHCFASCLVECENLSLVGSAEQKEVIDGANGANAFACAEVHLSLDLLVLLRVIVQLGKLLLCYLLLRESFPFNNRRKFYSFENISILSSNLPIFFHEVLLHDLMAAKMRKGRPFPLILFQHLIQQNLDILRTLSQTVSVLDDFRSGQSKAINVIFVGICVCHLPAIAMVVVLLQGRRAKPRCACESRRNLVGIAAESKICQFEVEPLSEDNNISRFYVPMHDFPRL